MRRTTRYIALAISASALTQNPLQAERLAYEGFDYTEANGTSVAGLNGGSGWDEAFPTPDGPHVLANGLTFTGLSTVGKSMNRSNGTLTANGRNWAASVDTSATYWYSYLLNSTIGTDGNGPEGTFNLFQTTSDNQNGAGIEFRKGTSGAIVIKVTGNGGATDVRTVPGGQTHWVLGRITNASHRVWVYAQGEALPTAEPTTGGTNITGTPLANRQAAMSGRRFGSSGANASITFDEIRVGNLFSEAFPLVNAEFTLAPSTAIQNQTISFSWNAVPTTATSIELDPGDINLLPLTTSGAGTTTLPAPAANTTYSLTYVNGGTPVTLNKNFTALAPSFTMPASGYLGDTLNLTWQVPVGSTSVTLNPGAVDLTSLTSGTNGTGATTIAAPSATTTYTLSYTFNSVTSTIDNPFTLLPSVLNVTPEQVIYEVSPIAISWRINPAYSTDSINTSVFLDVGPAGGPYAEIDVTGSTNATTGAGTYNSVTPLEGETNYRIRYHVGGIQQTLTDTITLFPKVFQLGTPLNNTKPVQTNLQPMFDGVAAYSDRGHVWAAVPSILQGAQFAKMGQDDKATSNLQIPFTAEIDGTFFLLIDNRMGDDVGGNTPATGTDNPPTLGGGVMDWVLTSGFVDSGVDVGLDEGPVSGTTTIDQSYSVFFRQVSQGETFTFLQQANGGFRNMYGIAAVSPQVVPVAFVVTTPVITKGASTNLQWTVPVGSTVTINNGVGNVTSLTDSGTGVGTTSVSPTVTTSYTMTYDPPGAATPAVNIGPFTVTVNDFTSMPDEIIEGESTTLAWQVPVGATAVTINNGVGDVTSLTNGTGAGSKIVSPTTTTYYTLSYMATGATVATNVATIPVIVTPAATPFESWMANNYAGINAPNNVPSADADSDGMSNLGEFAFGGDPNDATNDGITRSGVDSFSGIDHLAITLACRTGATFAGAGPMTSTIDGISYSIRASGDLTNFATALEEVTPAVTAGLPTLPTGYAYKTFRMTAARSSATKAFIQAVATEAP
jgi:hypothetical protein